MTEEQAKKPLENKKDSAPTRASRDKEEKQVKPEQEPVDQKGIKEKPKKSTEETGDTTTKIPDIKAGNVVRVYQKLKEKDKERTQVFEGMVIAKKGKTDLDKTITVRKVCDGGFGVERIFPLASPLIKKIIIVKKPKVRRAKLYYLRKSPRKMRELLTK